MNDKSVKKRKNRWIWVGIGVAVVVGILLVVFARQSAADDETPTIETVTAFIGDLSASASASGHVAARRNAELSVEQPGVVANVPVRVGDVVQAGAVLVELDTTDLAFNLASMEQALRVQEANLATLLKSASETDLAAARANVAAAQANLDDVLDGPSDLELAVQEANVRSAEANVTSSYGNLQSARDAISDAQIAAAAAQLAAAKLAQTQARLANEDNPTYETDQALRDADEQVAIAQSQLNELLDGPAVGSAQAGVTASAAQRDAAQANFEAFADGATATAIAAAEAQLAQAEAALNALVDGPTAADIRSAEAQVEQARLNVEAAQEALDKATLHAPFDGVITAVNIAPGEFASGVVVALTDSNSLELVLDVDEVDIGALAVGQPAVIALEAWPTVEIESAINNIAPSTQNNSSGLVTYQVYLDLGATDLPVRVGMTANANLITANRQDVLLVESRAIQANRQNGTFSVMVLDADGTTREVPVTIGLRDGVYTQITSGLQAGDEVLVGDLPTFDFDAESGPFGG
ncbi:MAG: efflux RND transporter periplasmic adaptor subunit [Anaerolineae bacterium]|nr:efflux RND transporter periplasmic adaptor subunit [Anaerolineae bacterium]